MEQFYRVPVQPPVREAVRKAAKALGEIGIASELFEPKGMERAPNLWAFFFDEPAVPYIRKAIAGRENDAHWTGTEFLRFYRERHAPSAENVFIKFAERDRLRARMLEQMEDHRVILMPVCGITAFPHRLRKYDTGEKQISQFEAMMPATPWNLFGFPAMTIPFDLSPEGLPVGVQLVGRPWEEELLLELAVKLEEARGPFPSPPGY
jgi:Asp-tRNA(Asn)/Glu-tRNA(Gln) amidotransferase A subunit family amidase